MNDLSVSAKRALLAFLLLCGSGIVHAAPPSDESVMTLLTLVQTQKSLEGVRARADQFILQAKEAAIQGKSLSPEQRRAFDAAVARLANSLGDEISADKMLPLYIGIYKEIYTQEEIDGLIAFFGGPLGASYIEKSPRVLQNMAMLMQSRLGPMMERVNNAVQKAAQDAELVK